MEKTALEKAEFERAMTLQVRNAQLSLITTRKTLDQRKRALDMTESIYERTQIKFREGVGSSVEVTQAEGQLFEAQGAYITALFELLNAKVDLDIAKGTLNQ
jgi:outer membrane protein TolC